MPRPIARRIAVSGTPAAQRSGLDRGEPERGRHGVRHHVPPARRRAFRSYLLTAVRRAAYDRHRAERRQIVTDQLETFDPGVPFADPAVADLERTMIARAFPDRAVVGVQVSANVSLPGGISLEIGGAPGTTSAGNWTSAG